MWWTWRDIGSIGQLDNLLKASNTCSSTQSWAAVLGKPMGLGSCCGARALGSSSAAAALACVVGSCCGAGALCSSCAATALACLEGGGTTRAAAALACLEGGGTTLGRTAWARNAAGMLEPLPLPSKTWALLMGPSGGLGFGCWCCLLGWLGWLLLVFLGLGCWAGCPLLWQLIALLLRWWCCLCTWMLAGLAAVALAVAVVAAAAAKTPMVQSWAPWKAPPLVGTKAEPWFRVAAKWAQVEPNAAPWVQVTGTAAWVHVAPKVVLMVVVPLAHMVAAHSKVAAMVETLEQLADTSRMDMATEMMVAAHVWFRSWASPWAAHMGSRSHWSHCSWDSEGCWADWSERWFRCHPRPWRRVKQTRNCRCVDLWANT